MRSSERIGGHEGLNVYRDRELDVIFKKATTEDAAKALHNEARLLEIIDGSGIAPKLLSVMDGVTVQEDAGTSEPVTDHEEFRRNCIRLLWVLRQRGVRHGDLTQPNLIIRNNRPFAIDWQESHLLDEPALEKQPWSDSAQLMKTIAALRDWECDGVPDESRTARRWGAVLMELGADEDFSLPLKGKTFVDLGCYEGDFPALARCEGMEAVGVDRNQQAIQEAEWRWTTIGAKFVCQEMYSEMNELLFLPVDVVLLFSVWPYLVQDHGEIGAKAFLCAAIRAAGTLFFETQIAGDGPGPPFLRTEADVGQLLIECGATETACLIHVPVHGRDAERSIWMARS